MDEQDLNTAALVHYSFLPEDYSSDRFDIAIKARPRNKIGGDYCSILTLGEKRLILCMCDAVGHDIASAFYAARVNTFVLSHCPHHIDPCDLLQTLNEFLCRRLSNSGIFTTFCAIFLNTETLEMEMTGAAHPPVLYYDHRRRTTEMLSSETTFLGLQHPLYPACSLHKRTLHSGDKVVLYTDGLIDDGWGESMSNGIDNLGKFIAINSHLSSVALNDALIEEAIKRNHAEPKDDMLVMTILVR
ncbi:MAG: serine/threonine-protein phosphatase [Nitrospirae bacterium]|nr:serine/threonine-protein phosphatase [Nitrospirota bacterium]